MANPFRRADRHGAPSIRPTPPESAETPMTDPAQTNDLLVNRPAAPPSAETPMEPPPAPPPPNHGQATRRELDAKTKTVAAGRMNPALRFSVATGRYCSGQQQQPTTSNS